MDLYVVFDCYITVYPLRSAATITTVSLSVLLSVSLTLKSHCSKVVNAFLNLVFQKKSCCFISVHV